MNNYKITNTTNGSSNTLSNTLVTESIAATGYKNAGKTIIQKIPIVTVNTINYTVRKGGTLVEYGKLKRRIQLLP
uniref:Uncharacterized protein n=1 Tax=viral metagenome TaxID=1070528 RepID=A0A6C0HAY3_9ZZZZ